MRQGTRRDAVLHSVGANAQHGLRRTNADKRRAVETLLRDEEWSGWSDSEIARRCGVSHPTVAKVRDGLGPILKSFQDGPRTVERNGTIYTQNTANIGKRPAPPPPAPAPAFPPHNPETGELVERDGVPIPARVPAEVWQAAQRLPMLAEP